MREYKNSLKFKQSFGVDAMSTVASLSFFSIIQLACEVLIINNGALQLIRLVAATL